MQAAPGAATLNVTQTEHIGMISQDYAQRALTYIPEKGRLRWRSSRPRGDFASELARKRWHTVHAGNVVKLDARIMLGGYRLSARQAIWLLVHGDVPTGRIERIKGHSNKLDNLRHVPLNEVARQSAAKRAAAKRKATPEYLAEQRERRRVVSGIARSDGGWTATVRGVCIGEFEGKIDAMLAQDAMTAIISGEPGDISWTGRSWRASLDGESLGNFATLAAARRYCNRVAS